MRLIGKIILLVATVTLLMAQKTDTTVTFGKMNYIGNDTTGESLYERDVKIDTKNYKVDTFWSRFSWDGKGEEQKRFASVATSGKVRIRVSSDFTCQKAGLDAQGCSGQKPFLINQGVLSNPDMQLDSEGKSLPSGEYRIPFDSAGNYNAANDDAFYALDVFRDGKYYSEGSRSDANDAKPKSFLGYIIALFRDYFSKDVNTYTTGTASPEQRNRYIANITFGHQQAYMLEKSSAIATTETNTANSGKKVSLLDYNSQIIEQTTGCNGLFFSYDPDSLTCKSIDFFGLSNFMPFVNNQPQIKVKSDSVVEDTETTLLALQGKLDNYPYLEKRTKVDAASKKRTVLSELFKPVTFMADSMFRFFFGSASKNITEMVIAKFDDFKHPMPLTFIVTDGTKVTDFAHFKLLGIESVYGTEVESCKVKDVKGIFGWRSSYETFTKGVPTNTQFDIEGGFKWVFHNPSEYNELNITKKTIYRGMFVTVKHKIVNVSTDDWLDWCKRNQGRQKKGLFGRIFETFKKVGNFLLGHSQNGATYDTQLDKLLKSENYEVVDYKEKIHKGLILHLKHLEALKPEMKGTTTTYKLVHIKRGN